MKYTKGPWRIGSPCGIKRPDGTWLHEPSYSVFCQRDDGDTSIAHARLADANLIAAAPELLLACEGALNALRLSPHVDKQQAIDYLIEVIKKARGE